MTRRSTETKSKMHKYKKEHKFCENCGEEKPLEVHHIKPLIKGGTDTYENFIALCSKCHKLVHEQDKGTLTKLGIEKRRKEWEDFEKNPNKYELISLVNIMDIYKWADEYNYEFDIQEFFEMLNNLHIYKSELNLKSK